MSDVAIIPARGGSRRIPHKNRRIFHGKPIICYSIECAFASRLFSEVYVSTDEDEIAAIAVANDCRVLYRPPEFADDRVGTQAVMQQALQQMDLKIYDRACCIYATCPMMLPEDLKRADIALDRWNTRYAFAVCEEPFGPAGMFYVGRATNFINGVPLVAEHSTMIPIPPERCIDINTESDWLKAEEMYARTR